MDSTLHQNYFYSKIFLYLSKIEFEEKNRDFLELFSQTKIIKNPAAVLYSMDVRAKQPLSFGVVR